MKNLNKIINIILVLLSCLVAVIYIFGSFKKSSLNSSDKLIVQRIDQSSVSGKEKSVKAPEVSSQDELTNKYMKELQLKLKKEELEASNLIKKAQNYQRPKSKNDDWTQVPVDQQISKDHPSETREIGSVEKSPAGTSFGGVAITKETAADFIETARKNGYHVILSDTYEVISVTPIMNTKGRSDSFETNPGN
jgi:hypothetical protein